MLFPTALLTGSQTTWLCQSLVSGPSSLFPQTWLWVFNRSFSIDAAPPTSPQSMLTTTCDVVPSFQRCPNTLAGSQNQLQDLRGLSKNACSFSLSLPTLSFSQSNSFYENRTYKLLKLQLVQFLQENSFCSDRQKANWKSWVHVYAPELIPSIICPPNTLETTLEHTTWWGLLPPQFIYSSLFPLSYSYNKLNNKNTFPEGFLANFLILVEGGRLHEKFD